jgi:hypothetical protein
MLQNKQSLPTQRRAANFMRMRDWVAPWYLKSCTILQESRCYENPEIVIPSTAIQRLREQRIDCAHSTLDTLAVIIGTLCGIHRFIAAAIVVYFTPLHSETDFLHHPLSSYYQSRATMISNFFVLSPRGDTIILKQYRSNAVSEIHERSHTEAFFRKIKFWEDNGDGVADEEHQSQRTGDAPPVFLMPDGHTYIHIKRNGLIFGASTVRNVSSNTVLEVRWILNPSRFDAVIVLIDFFILLIIYISLVTLYHCANI